MKRLSRILPFLLAVVLVPLPFFGQAQNGTIAGRVLDRDGTTPLAGATIWIDQLVTNAGRVQVRERLNTKTGRDGRYNLGGLYIGRVRVSVVVNGQAVMTKGDAIGDELYLATGLDTVANFDLSKAPAAPPAAAAAAGNAPSTAGLTDKEKEELRKKIEGEAAKSGLMYKAFEEGKTAFSVKNYDEAIVKFKSAIEQMPVPPPPKTGDVIWANLAMTYDAKREYGEAEAAYRKAIEFNPTESAYYVNLSLAQISGGKLEESQATIQKAAELNPANAGMAYFNMAATLINRNKPNEAIPIFKKAIELDPKYANAYYQLGITQIGQNQNAEAVANLTKYLELVPTGQDAETAKLLIEELKKTTPTAVTNPPAKGGSAAPKTQQPAKGK